MHVDEFIDELLHAERVCDIILPRLQVCCPNFRLNSNWQIKVSVRAEAWGCAMFVEEAGPGGGRAAGSADQCPGGRPGWSGVQWRRRGGGGEGRWLMANTFVTHTFFTGGLVFVQYIYKQKKKTIYTKIKAKPTNSYEHNEGIMIMFFKKFAIIIIQIHTWKTIYLEMCKIVFVIFAF